MRVHEEERQRDAQVLLGLRHANAQVGLVGEEIVGDEAQALVERRARLRVLAQLAARATDRQQAPAPVHEELRRAQETRIPLVYTVDPSDDEQLRVVTPEQRAGGATESAVGLRGTFLGDPKKVAAADWLLAESSGGGGMEEDWRRGTA